MAPKNGSGIEHGSADMLRGQAGMAAQELFLGHSATQLAQDMLDGDPRPLKTGLPAITLVLSSMNSCQFMAILSSEDCTTGKWNPEEG